MQNEEVVYELEDYLGNLTSVPESAVEAFEKEQAELKAKYGNKMSPEMEKAMAESRKNGHEWIKALREKGVIK